jgi:hypothetical protein
LKPTTRALLGVLLALAVVAIVMFLTGDDDSPDTGDTPPPSTTTTSAPEAIAPSSSSTSSTTMAPTAVYHVAADGDNGGEGTESDPWETIEHAEAEAIDGSLILVAPGEYQGETRLRGVFASGITIRSSEPYGARLRNNGPVIACYVCAGVTIEGFDIAHRQGDAERYVIQIQDADGQGLQGQRITLRNNVIHSSSNNDLLKINNGAGDILIEGNMFYNQRGPDSHMDINSASDVTVRGNVMFNDFGENQLGTASFVVIKDSNGENDRNLGSTDITVAGNVMFNWQGDEGAGFFSIGEDEVPYHQAHDVMVENNLLIGNSPEPIRAAFLAKGINDVTFRNNTIVGDLPGETFGLRLSLQKDNPPNERVQIYNNIWSDPFGTMGTELGDPPTEFADAPAEETLSLAIAGNLFWNGGAPIPFDVDGAANAEDDRFAVFADPLLPAHDGIIPPRWDPEAGRFADGSLTIEEVFLALVLTYGVPATGSPAIDAALAPLAPPTDILGNPRLVPDIGAFEVVQPASPVNP